jgi:hypothetical protein
LEKYADAISRIRIFLSATTIFLVIVEKKPSDSVGNLVGLAGKLSDAVGNLVGIAGKLSDAVGNLVGLAEKLSDAVGCDFLILIDVIYCICFYRFFLRR